MKFELSIIFAYNIHDCITDSGESGFFDTIDDLKLTIKNGRDYFKMPYKLRVTRTVKIVDLDLDNEHNIISVPYTQIRPHILKLECCDFIVSDKLTYPRDVREILTKKYGNTLNFDTRRQWDEKQPVFLDGVTMRDVVCYPLTNKNIIIDENLNKIYPKKTGKTPSVLTELLSKQAIEIIQR